jgi:GNAT superfamily N-acetyltransferase
MNGGGTNGEAMRIVDFDFDPGLLAGFIDFPRRHYAGDPNWLPDGQAAYLLSAERASVTASHWRNFLVCAPDRDGVLGRVTAIVNPSLREAGGSPYGQLGFFECVDDGQAARLLVEAACGWLRATGLGIQTVLAPMNFDTWHAYRLRVSGFDQPTFAMEPHNPPYYAGLFQQLGFRPLAHYATRDASEAAALLPAWEPFFQDVLARGYRFRPLDRSALNDELALIYHLSVLSFRDNFLFQTIPEAEFRAMYAPYGSTLDPELITFLLDPAGTALGFSFAFPDHRRPDTVNHKTIGIVPDARGDGLGAALGYAVYSRLLAKGFSHINQCLYAAGNRASTFNRGLGTITREYALLSRALG